MRSRLARTVRVEEITISPNSKRPGLAHPVTSALLSGFDHREVPSVESSLSVASLIVGRPVLPSSYSKSSSSIRRPSTANAADVLLADDTSGMG
jgi:hypothetical protein